MDRNDMLIIRIDFITPDMNVDEGEMGRMELLLDPSSGREFAQGIRSGILMKLREMGL